MPDQYPVAIIGMGCLFPKSKDLKEYWQLLYHGRDAITEVPESHWSPAEYFDDDPKRPDHVYCKRGGFLEPVSFDPAEFGIPPSSLAATDTSQLLGLLVAKMALEDCGYGDNQDFNRERTSVILGVTGTQELVIPLSSRLGHPKWRKALQESAIPPDKTEEIIQKISDSYVGWQESSFPGLLGNVVAGRICNRLDLRGTNCVVDAACASSMSAVHLALLELMSGRSDMVVTGGVDTLNDIFMHMCFSKTHTLSATGDARPFSKAADGTVLGEGIGMLVLKRLADAERDANKIYAVIKGLGTSSDGKSQSIYSPRSDGQIRALRTAYESTGVSPTSVQLIEAHGTGTRVGDKVEFEALSQVFKEFGANGHKCALGSVKSMIGHTKASAGAAGLIKAALGLYHKVLPPTLKAETPDPNLNLENSNFYLNTSTRPWFSKNGDPRRAGVSAFGFGGSNFHVVLEEYGTVKKEISWDGSIEILAFSAGRREEIVQRVRNLKKSVENNLSDPEFRVKAAESRQTFSSRDSHRLVIVCDNIPKKLELMERVLKAVDGDGHPASTDLENIYIGGPQKPGKLAFVFPGQGSQYLQMGRDIVCMFPQAMQVLENANKKFKTDLRLSEVIFPPNAHSAQKKKNQDDDLKRTDTAQPAIGAISLAMLKVIQEFGISPNAAGGHSFGELTALCAAGWISESDLLSLSVLRGQLMAATGDSQNSPEGAMLAVKAPLTEIEALIAQSGLNVILANLNSPNQGVLSGPTDAIIAIEKICRKEKISAVRLPVSAAFHSQQVKSAVQPFLKALRRVEISPTTIDVFSNTTGMAYPAVPDEARILLGEHLMRPVNFVNEIENLYKSGVRTFVEIGPKSILTGLIGAILQDRDHAAAALDASAGKAYGIIDLARLLARLAALGYPVTLSKWENPLPVRRKAHMNVLLSGSNFRDLESEVREPKKEDRERRTEDRRQKQLGNSAPLTESEDHISLSHIEPGDPNLRNYPNKFNDRNLDNLNAPTLQISNNGVAGEYKDTMNEHRNNLIRNAYQVVAEGLKSMQDLQRQTAQAHEKFLQTQAEANRILQEMMKNTQRLAEKSLGIQTDTTPPDSFYQYETQKRSPVQTSSPHANNRHNGPATPEQATRGPRDGDKAEAAPVTAEWNLPQAAANGYRNETGVDSSQTETVVPNPEDRTDIAATLLTVVSQLTGYPQEMLGLDMDIEAELGIDSIKRVEILSNLEENIPDLPTVSPEIMANLKTLGQIAAFLSLNDSRPADENPTNYIVQTAPLEPAAMRSAKPAANDIDAVAATLLAIVSRLTGYPQEMLGLDMDIEAELGIDSIKRVEILSALEETLPGLPSISPDMMGTLKTLGQIIEFISGGVREDTVAHRPDITAPVVPPATAEMLSKSAATHRDDLTATLLAVVSQLTGYPMEMLGLEMDIEAELGIDSIKRVEILSAIEEKMPALPAVSPDMMGTLKTLGQIVDYLAKPAAGDPAQESVIAPQPKILAVIAGKTLKASKNAVPPATVADTIPIARNVVKLVEAPPISKNLVALPGDKKVFVTEDNTGLSEEITEALAKRGIKTVRISLDILKHKKQLPAAAGLIIVQNPESHQMDQDLKDAFGLTKYLAPNLIESAKDGGAVFATVTRLDGAFAFHHRQMGAPVQGGLAGLVKTAAIEWKNVCCHAIDIAPDWADTHEIATAVIKDILSPGPIEIGLDARFRSTLSLVSEPYPAGSINLNAQDVVVISGGAKGVTAAAAFELAKQTGTSLVLLGRSPRPFTEPKWIASIEGEAAIKKAIIENEYRDRKATPAAIEKGYRQYLANREISNNLRQLKSTGASVYYYSADVRDSETIQAIMAEIRSNIGPITGIVHGAGVLEDRLIIDKTPEQFERVYDTKVRGLKNLLKAAGRDPLKYLVLFSSVAARMGNQGQADYAVANEVLNKIAQAESARRKGCRVVSINWGPWDGGMVSPALKREFESRGIHLIPFEYGAKCMLREMTGGGDSPVEIVIGAELNRVSPGTPKRPNRPALIRPSSSSPSRQFALSFEREIDIHQYPVLKSHIIDGKPVVPLALMMEWFAHSALHANPGLVLQGLDGIRVMKGIRLEHDKHQIRLLAGKLQKNGEFYEVEVELRDGKMPGQDILHSKARAILGNSLTAAPPYEFSNTMIAKAYTKNMKEVYDKILFHGLQLHGIHKIISCSSRGMVAHIAAAPAPGEWIATPLRNQWIADPLVLDCAFQMATVWCFEEKGILSLPSYGASYRQYRHRFPSDGVKAVLNINEVTQRKMQGDFTLLDANDEIVAQLTGYEAIMDASLVKAFKPQYRASA